ADARRARPRSSRFRIGIVGRIDKVKGHEVLLQALARLRHLPGMALEVLGTGPREARCRRLAGENGVGDMGRVAGVGPAGHARMGSLAGLVLPGVRGALPSVLLEAMYLKVPIVASRVGGLREVLEPAGCGALVPVNDPAALAEAIERLYGDPDLRATLATR